VGFLGGAWGEIAGLLSAVSAACSSLMVRGLGPGRSPMAINALRCCVAALGFFLLWLLGSASLGDWAPALPLLACVSLAGLVVGDSLYFGSISRLGSGRATPIAMSYPVPTALLEGLVFGEAIPAMKLAGIVLGVSAIWLIVSQSQSGRRGANRDGYWIGVAQAAAASICWSLSVLILRTVLDLVPLDFANLVRMSFAALLLSFISFRAFGEGVRELRSRSFAVLIVALGCAAVVTSYMLIESVYHSGAAIAALMSSMTPVFVAPLAWLFFSEKITLRMSSGIGLGVVSIGLVILSPG
jgi:drug/metabolite transporter (DMT)-like permease